VAVYRAKNARNASVVEIPAPVRVERRAPVPVRVERR
jgi:hypothetical protein